MRKISNTTKFLLTVLLIVTTASFYYAFQELEQTMPKHATYIIIDVSRSTSGDAFNLREQATALLDKFPLGSYITIVTVSDYRKVISEGYLENEFQRNSLKTLIRRIQFSQGKGTFLYQCSWFVMKKGINTARESFDVVMLTDCEPDYDIPRAIVIPGTCRRFNIYCTSQGPLSPQASEFVMALKRTAPNKVVVQDLMSMRDYLQTAVDNPMNKIEIFILSGALLGLVLPSFTSSCLSFLISLLKRKKSDLYWIIKAGDDKKTLMKGDEMYLPISTRGFNGYPVRDSVKISAGEQAVRLLHIPHCKNLDKGEYLLSHGLSERLPLSTGAEVKITAYLKRRII